MTDALDAALGQVHGAGGAAPERDPLDDALEQVHGEGRAPLAALQLQAEGANPDQAAEGLRLGREAGVPDAVAIENTDQLRADSEARRLDRLHAESPVLAKWLADPANMAVAKDDVESLSAFGKALRYADLGDLPTPHKAVKALLTDPVGSARFGADALKSFWAGLRYRGPEAVFGLGAAAAESAGQAQDALGLTDPMRAMARAFGTQAGENAATRAGGELLEESQAIGRDAAALTGDRSKYSVVQRGALSGLESLGAQALPTLVSFLTGNPAPMLTLMGLQTTGQAYSQAREQGVDPLSSLEFSGGQGLIEVGTELLPALNLFKNLKLGSPVWKTITQAAVADVPGEQVATALQDFNEFASLPENADKTIGDYLAARPAAAAETLVASLVASTAQSGALAGVDRLTNHLSSKAQKDTQARLLKEHAERVTGALSQVDAAFDATKLAQRSPEKAEEVAQALAEGRDTVYLPTEQFETYYQSQNVAPAEAWAHLTGDANGYAAARATGADLQIPYAKYLARLTPEERKALTPHLRLSPEAMNAVEAEAFGKERERILGDTAAEPAGDPAYDFIYNDLLGQLMQRFPRDVADKYAAAEASRFVAFNRAAGTDPVEDYKANAPKIISEIPEPLRRVEFNVEIDPLLERLRAGNVPTEREVRGPSLLEFLRSKGGVQDQGGELSTMDAEQADRAIRVPGQRKLVNPEGMTLDEAREAAVAAGYLTEAEADQQATSDISQLLSAIDSELRGTAVYAQGREDARADTERRTLTELGDFLAQSGVDLNTVSNEQIKQFLQTGVAPPEMQQQDQTVLEQSPHFARLKAGDVEVPEGGFSPEDKRGFGELHRRGLANVVERDGKKFLTVGRGLWYEDATDAQRAVLDRLEGGVVEFADYEFIPSGDDIFEAGEAAYTSMDVAPRTREIPIADLGLSGYDTPKDLARIRALADRIAQSKQIAQVFVGLEPDGSMYLMEGQHRARALQLLGHKTVPARVVVSLEEPRPVKATDTPEFRAWFGDSKVVDAEGKPLVVYHGTTESFDAFDPAQTGLRQGQKNRKGGAFFFTNDKTVGSGFAEGNAAVEAGDRPNVMPVYLSLKNPYVDDAGGKSWKDVNEAAFRRAKGGKHDGIILRNVKDFGRAADALAVEAHDVYIAFRPEQIKSAIGNRGTFDPSDPNILHQSAIGQTGGIGMGLERYSDNVLQFLFGEYGRRARTAPVTERERWEDHREAVQREIERRGGGTTLLQAAYHGSPHDFDKFSLDKIGTGEGAQAYGWGLYFAENPGVAGMYHRNLAGAPAIKSMRLGGLLLNDTNHFDYSPRGNSNYENVRSTLAETLMLQEENIRAAGSNESFQKLVLKELDARIKQLEDEWPEGVEAAKKLRADLAKPGAVSIRLAKAPGGVYQVDIPDSATARMLDWDSVAPMEQLRAIARSSVDAGHFDGAAKEALEAMAEEAGGAPLTGQRVYQMFVESLGSDKAASEFLRGAGIPGIRYLDQGSRNSAPVAVVKNAADEVVGQIPYTPNAMDGPIAKLAESRGESPDGYTIELRSDGTRNLVVFDDSIVKITHKDGSPVTAAERKEYLQAAADGSAATKARGQIRFTKGPGQRQFEITLKDADLSTFVHEMGHYWLERMGDAAERAEAPQQIKDDYAAILKWLGVSSRAEIGTEQHEQFARGGEAYLMEGKAPSIRLRAVFARLRNFMLQVYERLTRLNVSLTPEVRAVFDRLYASQQEIEQARNAQFLKPLWPDRESAGMTEEQWRAYVTASDAARSQAEEELAAEAMEPIRREEQDWWKDKRKAVAKEVLTAVNRRKDIVALTVLRTGKMPDGAKVEVPKLSKDALVKDFGLTAESLAKLPRGIYTAGEGASADDLAPTFGYASGRELIEALGAVPDKRQLVKELVEAELKRRYPDIIDDGSIGDRAMLAVHNDKAGELLVREAQILADRAKVEGKTAGLRRYQLSRQMAKAAAQQVIEGTPLKDIQPARWKAAEAKAGNEAYRLAREGKLAEAAAAKQRQVLNHFLYREAVDALEATERRVKHARSLSEKGAREAIGKAGGNEYVATYRDGTQEVFDSRKSAEEAVADKPGFWFPTNTYLEQIDSLLERYDLRARTNRKLASRESLRAFADRLTADGIPHEIPEDVIADARQVNYRELPYGYFAAVSDAVRSIEYVALKKSELIIAGQKRDRDEAAAEIRDSIIGNKPPRLPGVAERGRGERMLDAGNEALSVYLNANYITREMDGGKAGAVNALLYRPIIEAAVHVDNRKEVVHQALAAIYEKHYSKAELRAMASQRGANAVPVKEIGETWTKWDVVSLALNWGNEGNREAILRGRYAGDRRITQAMVDRLLGLNGQPGIMTAKDWAFAQDVWKYVDSFWPEIKAKQQQRTGTAPEKVGGTAFQTSAGQIAGGYYPLQYDSRQGGKAGLDAQDDVFEALRTGRFGRAQTKRGHTEARVGSGGRPVTIGMEVLTRHLQNVVYDLEMGDAITSVYKLLEHKGVEQAFTEAGKKAHHRQLRLWLKDVATGEIIASHWAEQLLRFLRVNFTKAVLTFKVSSAALQITGVSQTSAILGPKYTWRGLQQVLTRQPWSAKGWAEQIKAASPAMRARWERGGYNPAVADVMNAAQGKRIPSWVWGAGYWMMGRVQMIADAVTWMGAHAKAVDAGKSPGEALAAADDMVNRAQGSGLFADRSALERGTLSENVRQTEFIRAFTVLMSYMMAKGRMAYELTRNTDFKSPTQIARYTVQMAMIFTVEALLVALIRGKLPDDDDDDGVADEVGMFALKQTALGLVGTVPGLTYLGSEIQGFRGGPPFLEWAESIGKLSQQVDQGEIDKALLRAGSDVAGVLTGFPSSQANITLDAFWRASEGEDVSPIEYLMRVKKDE